MIKLTKPQRKALYRVYERTREDAGPRTLFQRQNGLQSYRAFRRTVQPGPGCVMVRYAGMWLGIEPDGYTHS
jgi:hypothetical protein